MDSLHLLAALLAETDGLVKPILDRIGAGSKQLIEMVRSELSRSPKVSGGATPQPNSDLRKVLEKARPKRSGCTTSLFRRNIFFYR